MNKIEKDGNVAVLYSPGYGAGWSTWNDDKYQEMLWMVIVIKLPILQSRK